MMKLLVFASDKTSVALSWRHLVEEVLVNQIFSVDFVLKVIGNMKLKGSGNRSLFPHNQGWYHQQTRDVRGTILLQGSSGMLLVCGALNTL